MRSFTSLEKDCDPTTMHHKEESDLLIESFEDLQCEEKLSYSRVSIKSAQSIIKSIHGQSINNHADQFVTSLEYIQDFRLSDSIVYPEVRESILYDGEDKENQPMGLGLSQSQNNFIQKVTFDREKFFRLHFNIQKPDEQLVKETLQHFKTRSPEKPKIKKKELITGAKNLKRELFSFRTDRFQKRMEDLASYKKSNKNSTTKITSLEEQVFGETLNLKILEEDLIQGNGLNDIPNDQSIYQSQLKSYDNKNSEISCFNARSSMKHSIFDKNSVNKENELIPSKFKQQAIRSFCKTSENKLDKIPCNQYTQDENSSQLTKLKCDTDRVHFSYESKIVATTNEESLGSFKPAVNKCFCSKPTIQDNKIGNETRNSLLFTVLEKLDILNNNFKSIEKNNKLLKKENLELKKSLLQIQNDLSQLLKNTSIGEKKKKEKNEKNQKNCYLNFPLTDRGGKENDSEKARLSFKFKMISYDRKDDNVKPIKSFRGQAENYSFNSRTRTELMPKVASIFANKLSIRNTKKTSDELGLRLIPNYNNSYKNK